MAMNRDFVLAASSETAPNFEEENSHIELQTQATRSARRMSTAAAILAALSATLVVAMRLSSGRAAEALPASASDLVGLSTAAQEPTSMPMMTREAVREGSQRGWQRTYLPGAIRAGPAADAAVVRELSAGSLVYATGSEGESLRISRPVAGWVSAASPDGVKAVYPEMALRSLAEGGDAQSAVLQDPHRALNEKLRAQVAEATAVQVKLAANARHLKETTKMLQDQSKASKVAAAVAKSAGGAAVKVAADRGVQRMIAGFSKAALRGVN